MIASPVRRYRLPGYPAKLEVQINPYLLRRHLPQRWRALPEMAGAVALFLSVNTSGSRGADESASAAMAVVAPIFEDGEGRASTGCVVVAPPVFMSEETALQVIREELGPAGVALNQKRYSVEGATVPLAEYFAEEFKAKAVMRPRQEVQDKQRFQADGADPEKKIVVEFVSAVDFQQRCGFSIKVPNGVMVSSVQTYATREFAGFVADQVKKQATEKVYFGTFYDPLVVKEVSAASSIPASAPEESKRLLRLQVQDFVKWLKAQGAI